jgi:hypothetical protein
MAHPLSSLPYPQWVERGRSFQQLKSHIKAFKREHKIPNWSSLTDHLTKPGQAETHSGSHTYTEAELQNIS